jgi:hypothetical protein
MSLLKRIEKSQQPSSQPNAPAAPAGGGAKPPAPAVPTGGDQSKLAEMRLKRMPASASPTRARNAAIHEKL